VVEPAPPISAETTIQQPTPQPPPPDSVTGRLVIQASNVSLAIPQGKTVIVIGREDPVSGVFPDIDLDPHGGHEGGVGRRHAQIILQGGQLYIEDLDSVNGTVVNKQKIAPRQPRSLNHGDELRFGKMVLTYYSN
jgi:pSer/pThr/pTyr-binding forkhead associated (FHA) protein